MLEVGSGPGGNLHFLYGKGCSKLLGVDLSERVVALSKQLLDGKGIPILEIDGENLPFENSRFDVVFTTTVLQQLCAEICRVSKKRGVDG